MSHDAFLARALGRCVTDPFALDKACSDASAYARELKGATVDSATVDQIGAFAQELRRGSLSAFRANRLDIGEWGIV